MQKISECPEQDYNGELCEHADLCLEKDRCDSVSVRSIAESNFLNALCDGMVIINEDMKVTYQNVIARSRMGSIAGQHCYTAMEGSSSPCSYCPMLTGASEDFEISIRHAGGSTDRWYNVRIYPIMGPEGKVAGVMEIYPDMLDRKAVLQGIDPYEEDLSILNELVDKTSRMIDITDILNYKGIPGDILK